MSNMKSVIGFDDNLSNGLQEFAPTSYAVSKMRAARTPYGLNGSVIKDVNDIFKPGLYLLGAGTEHTKNDSYVLTDSDTGYLYFLGPDPDESLKGGHILTNKREATGVTFREILYMNQGSSNVITTRFGRYITDISNTTSNLGLHHIESIQSLYDTCPADGSKILCWVEDIALWITANRKQDLVEWHPAIRWGAWQSIGTGASGGSGGSSVSGSMSMELLENSKEATPNTIYVSFGDYTLTLPDPSICSLGDKVRLDQWANTGRVINLDGTIDVTTTPCVNGVDQADFTWSGDNIIPDGTIFHHSTEEGLTWSAVANNTTYVIKQVSFLDDAVRYVLTTADSSVILRLCYTEVTYPFVEEAEWANITTLAGGYPIPENVNISDITRGISAAHKVHPVLIAIDTDLIGCISYEFELTYDGYNQDPNTKIWVLLKSNDDETVVASIQRMVGNKVVKHTTEIENLWDKVSSLDIEPLISRVSSVESTVVDYINTTSQVYIREHSAAMDYANEIIASAAIDHDNITSAVYSAAKAYTDSQVSPVSTLALNNSSRIDVTSILASANSSRINVTSNKVSATSSSLVALSAVVSSHVNGGHDTGHWTAAEIAGMADLTGVSSVLSATSSMAKSTSTTLSSVSSSVNAHITGGKNTGHWTAEQLSSMMPSSAIPGVNTLTAGTTNVIITSGTNDATGKGDLVISVVQPVKLASSAGGTGCVISEVAGDVGTLDYDRLNLMYDAYKSNTTAQSEWLNDYTVPTAAAVAKLVASRSVTVQPGLAGVATLTTNDGRITISSDSEPGQGNLSISFDVSDIESNIEATSSTVSAVSSSLNNTISTLDDTASTVNAVSSSVDEAISTVNGVSSTVDDIVSSMGDIDTSISTSAGVHSLSPGTNNVTISSNGTDFTISVNATSVALAQGAGTGNCDVSDVAGVVGTLDYQRLTQMYTAAKNGTNLESSWLNDYTVPTAEAVARTIAAAMPSTTSGTSQVSYNDGPIYGFASNISSYVNDVSNIVSNTSSRLGVVSELVSSNDVILSSVSDVAATASTKASAVSSSLLELDSFVSDVSATVSNIDSSLTAVSSTVDSHTDLISSASDLADTASSLAASASDSVSALSDIVDGVSNTVDTVSNTVSTVSSTVNEVSNTVDTVSSTVSSVSNSVSALQSNFDTVSGDHYAVSSSLDITISSASALQEAFDTINNPTSAHIYGGNDTGHWTAGQIQGMIQAGSAGIAISEGANVTIDPITDPNTSITTYYISASPTTYSLCNGSNISGIVVASNNVISTYGNTAETSYVVPTMRAVYNMSSALNSAIGTKQAAGDYASATHSHTIANISDLQTALDGKQVAGDYALSNHSHTIANVSGLQDALNGKASTGHNHNGVYATTDHITILSSGDNVTLSSSVNGSQTTYYISASDTSYGSATGYSTTLGVVATVTEVDSDYESNYQVPTVAAVYSYGSAISSYATAVSRAVSNVDSTLSAVSGTVDTVSTTAKNASNTASAAASTANAVSTDFYDTSSVVSNMDDTLDELVIHYNATSDTVSEISSTLVNDVIDSATSLQTSFEAVSTDFYTVSGNIETIIDSATSLQTSFDTVSDTVSEISSTLMSDVIESATSLQTSFEAVSTDFYYVSNDVSVIIDSATSLQSAYDATSNLVSEVSSDFYNTSSGISSHINGGSETGHWTEEELLAKINTGVTGVAISGVSNISVTNSNVNSINTFYVSAMINGVTTSGISAWVDSQGTYIQGIDATTYLESGGPGTAIFGVVKVAKEYERGIDPFFRGYSNQTTYNPDWDSADSFVPSLKLIHKNYLPKQMAVAVNHQFFSDTSTCAAMRNKYLAWKHGGAVAPIAAHGITEIKNVWSNLSASEINVAASNYGSNISDDNGESSGTRHLFAENCAVPTFHTFAVAISELQTSIGTGGGTPIVVSQGSGITVESSAAGSSMVYKVSGTFCNGTTQVGIVRASNAIVSTTSTNATTGSSNVAETKYIVPTMRAVWSMSSALNSAIGTKTSYNLCNGSSITGVVKASNSIISTAGTAGNPETSYIVPTMRAVYNMSSTLASAINAKKTVSVVAGDNVSVASSTNGNIVSYIVSCLASGGGPGGSVDLLASLTAADASVTNKAVTPAAVIGSFINTSMMGFNVGTITPFLNALGFGFYTKNNAYCLDEFKADMSMVDSRLRVKTNGGYFAYPYAQPSCNTYSTNINGLMNNSSRGKYGKAISKYHDAVMNSSEYIEEYLVTDAVSSASFQAQVTALNVVSNPNMIVWKDTCVTLPFGPVISGKTHRFVVEFGRTVPVVAGDDYPHKQYLLKPVDELLYCGLTIINPTKDDHQLYDLIPQYINNIYASDANGVCIQGFNHMFQRVWLVPACNAALQMAYVTIGIEHQAVSTTVSAENCQWPYAGILNDTSFTSTPETGEDGHTGVLEPHVGKVVVSTETGFWNLDAYWGNHANMSQILMSSTDCWYQYGSDYHRTATDAVEEGEDVETTRPPSSAGDTLSDIILNSGTGLELASGVSDKYQSAVNVTINSGASAYVGEGTYMKGVKLHG